MEETGLVAMGSIKAFKDQLRSFIKHLLPWALYGLFPLTLLLLYFNPYSHFPQSFSSHQVSHDLPPTSPTNPAPNNAIAPTQGQPQQQGLEGGEIKRSKEDVECNYFDGKWVAEETGPLYNGSSCDAFINEENCLGYGRPDAGYLYWRWKPKQCDLPRFNASNFLSLVQNKHLAFVGDSLARNQLESLLCLLSAVSPPSLLHSSDNWHRSWARWHFPSHNLTISVYWAPYVVRSTEKSEPNYNESQVYLDTIDDRWAPYLAEFDTLVFSMGHWFNTPTVFYENDLVQGCTYCPELNHSRIGFYNPYRKALNTTLKAVIDRRGEDAVDVILATFSPSHFEGDWRKGSYCPKQKPFEEGEKALEAAEAEMRKIAVEELQAAIEKMKEKKKGKEATRGLRLQALDVTMLALMRPDGHPGPYMNTFSLAKANTQPVPTDCLHWCLPGPIDTWNEILLELIQERNGS